MKTVITVQHAQSIQHTNGMIGSWTDWDLTHLGVEQAARIGKNLAKELQDTHCKLYSSDLLRARRTAEAAAEALKLEIVFDERLRERNLGEAVGKSKEWAHANTIQWEKTVDDRAFRGAESRRDTWNRLLPFYRALLADGAETSVVVSHGDTLSLFHAMWLGLPVEALNTCGLHGRAAGVSFLEIDGDGKHLIRRLSDMSFASL